MLKNITDRHQWTTNQSERGCTAYVIVFNNSAVQPAWGANGVTTVISDRPRNHHGSTSSSIIRHRITARQDIGAPLPQFTNDDCATFRGFICGVIHRKMMLGSFPGYKISITSHILEIFRFGKRAMVFRPKNTLKHVGHSDIWTDEDVRAATVQKQLQELQSCQWYWSGTCPWPDWSSLLKEESSEHCLHLLN